MISPFFCIVSNLTKQSYKDFESVHRISGISDLSVAFMTAPMSNPCAISYSSIAKTLRIILLHFIKDQCMIFALFVALVK